MEILPKIHNSKVTLKTCRITIQMIIPTSKINSIMHDSNSGPKFTTTSQPTMKKYAGKQFGIIIMLKKVGKPHNDWLSKDIRYIQDIINHEGKLISKIDLEDMYSMQCKHLDYESLVHAIPAQWKQILRQNKTLNLNYDVMTECILYIDSKIWKLEEISTK